MSLDRSIRWRGLETASLEHAHVVATPRDTRIRSTLITSEFGLFYRIKLDEADHVRTLRVERTDGKVLELFCDGAGNWSDDRADPLPALRGCVDIDISASPMTNSLPIWRCDWVLGQPQRFAMARIDADGLTVRRDDQIYTRLDDTHFRYQSVASTFERLIEVDSDGIVLDYPGLFVRAD